MSSSAEALSVSAAMELAKGALEALRLRVVGEISECTVKPGYKAIYFTLADAGAVMSCLMWRDAYDRVGIELKPGMLVEVGGSFTAYAAKGRMQFQVRTLECAGEGALRLRVAALARKLEAEGLMDESRKRPLPPYPRRIGVVTSPRGKAVHDIIRTLGRRYPSAELVIAGVQVEGEQAAAEIVRGLESTAAEREVDVIILGRGGGSYEDLMPFNTEVVARAVASCPVPVVTGVGHEPDTTIADMVADVRASTPTAAAEAVAPAREHIARGMDDTARLLARALAHAVTRFAHRVQRIGDRPVFADAGRLLGAVFQATDIAADGLARALPERVRRDGEALVRLREGLVRIAPRITGSHAVRLEPVARAAGSAGRRVIERAETLLAHRASRLDDLSPLGILARGYAVCRDGYGNVVRRASDVEIGARVLVRVAEGSLACSVEGTEMED